MKNCINLLDEHIIGVEFVVDDISLYGNLLLSPGRLPSLEIRSNHTKYDQTTKNHDKIICHSDNRLIILYDCHHSFNFIYPQFLTFDLPEDAVYDSFEFSLDGMNSIVNKSSCMMERDRDKYILGLKKPCFDVHVEGSSNIKRIYDYWLSWTDHEYGNSLVTKIFQRHIIRIEAKKQLSLQEVQEETVHVRNLMMLINLRLLNINFAWIVCANQRYPVYFCHGHHSTIVHDGPVRSLVNINELCAERWGAIFNNSYHDKNFNNLWPRFCGMLSYNSYWEFEVLGYMSILDSYLTLRFNPKNKKGGMYHFRKRFIRLKEHIPPEVINFMGINDDIFNALLKVRNEVAHCAPDGAETPKDMTVLISRMRKIIILLNYIVLKDLGFDDKEYAEIAIRSNNSMLLESSPEKKWLSKYIGNVKTITIPDVNIQELKSDPGYISTPIFVNDPEEGFRYDKLLTEQYKEQWRINFGKHSKTTDYVDEYLCIDAYASFEAEYINKIHITLDDSDFLEMNNIIMLNPKDVSTEELTAITN